MSGRAMGAWEPGPPNYYDPGYRMPTQPRPNDPVREVVYRLRDQKPGHARRIGRQNPADGRFTEATLLETQGFARTENRAFDPHTVRQIHHG